MRGCQQSHLQLFNMAGATEVTTRSKDVTIVNKFGEDCRIYVYGVNGTLQPVNANIHVAYFVECNTIPTIATNINNTNADVMCNKDEYDKGDSEALAGKRKNGVEKHRESMAIKRSSNLFGCKVCNKLYTRACSVDRHANAVHFGLKPFQCEECSNKYAYESSLRKHMKKVHRRLPRRNSGSACDKLQLHKTDKEPRDTTSRNYVCSICNKAFKTSSHLKCHNRIHTGEKPYKCGTCGMAFAHCGSMRRHERCHVTNAANSMLQLNKRLRKSDRS